MATDRLSAARERSGPTAKERPRSGAPALDVPLDPVTLARLVDGADTGTRERLFGTLQRQHGNAAVGSLLAPGARALPVQRWAVGLPAATADCATVVDFLNANSPHRATSGWAKTSASFGWDATPAYSGSGSATTAEVTNPSVTKSVRVDMPSWAPTDPAMAGAWSGMTRDLRAHEARHEGIASTWESTLRTNLGGLSVTVPNRTNDAFTAAVRRPWNGWIAEHQADQNAIDPFSALLDCGGGDSESGGGAAPDLGPDLDAEPDLGD